MAYLILIPHTMPHLFMEVNEKRCLFCNKKPRFPEVRLVSFGVAVEAIFFRFFTNSWKSVTFSCEYGTLLVRKEGRFGRWWCGLTHGIHFLRFFFLATHAVLKTISRICLSITHTLVLSPRAVGIFIRTDSPRSFKLPLVATGLLHIRVLGKIALPRSSVRLSLRLRCSQPIGPQDGVRHKQSKPARFRRCGQSAWGMSPCR